MYLGEGEVIEIEVSKMLFVDYQQILIQQAKSDKHLLLMLSDAHDVALSSGGRGGGGGCLVLFFHEWWEWIVDVFNAWMTRVDDVIMFCFFIITI